MTKLLSVILIVACLFILSACQTTITPMLEVPDQSIEDGKVSINLAIDAAGWLVLHPATPEGEPDTSVELATISLTAAREQTDIQVTVPVIIGGDRTIFARLYYDDPLDGEFEPSSDNTTDPVVTTESGVVQDSFIIPGISPYIEMEQSATTGIVTINVAIDEIGWLILRPATTEGEPDTSTVLEPAVYLSAASEYTLNITLPNSITAGSTIFAMLYYDNPAGREFTYTTDGDDDPPVQVNGSDVVEALVVGG